MPSHFQYIPREQRDPKSRCVIRLVSAGRQPRLITLSHALKLHKQVLVDGLADTLAAQSIDPPLLLGFVSASATEPAAVDPLPDSFDLLSVGGVIAAHAAVGCDLDEASAASWLLAQTTPASVSSRDCALFLRAVNLASCSRVACPSGGASLQAALLDRHRISLLEPALPAAILSLSPLCYRELGQKPPVDWLFIAPPAGAEALALALAVRFACFGVAMLMEAPQLLRCNHTMWQLLLRFKVADQLAILKPAQEGDGVWVIVFAASGFRATMLSTCNGSCREGWVCV